MENPVTQTPNYNSLTKKGLRLLEKDFNLMCNALTTGVEEAKKFLNVSADPWPKLYFSNDTSVLGFSPDDDAICLSIDLLNQQAARLTELEYKDQLVLFIPDVFYIITKYLNWLKLLGREATIHRYQKIGNPQLHIPFPQSFPASFSSKLLLLSNLEVEARTITDKIAGGLGENPFWQSVDTYFSQNYPQYYNKSIEELTSLPKPTFPVSIEMEYYL